MDSQLQMPDLGSVSIDDEFWNERIRTNRTQTLERQYQMMEETGRIENFHKASEGEGEFEGRYYNDSDVYKWVEAASNTIATSDDPAIEDRLEEVASAIEAAQEPDGYLNTYFTLEREPEERWTNLRRYHELYCAGHFIEAAIAHHRATGERQLLDVAIDLADHIDNVFGPDNLRGYPGHPEIELALVKLYRETGTERYLDLSEFFVRERGRENSRFEWEINNPDEIFLPGEEPWIKLHADDDGEYDGRYAQDHAPLLEQDTVEGHAVRAMYLYAGAADVAEAGNGDEELVSHLEHLWENLATKRSYVTGGIGSSSSNEGFTEDYDLPTEDAYAESCAAVGGILFSHRMRRLTGEAKYSDFIERILYNGFLAGVSRSGEEFFYVNPLASHGDHHRQGWFTTACCPPNVARLLSSLDQYLYLHDDESLSVEQYISSTTTVSLNGSQVQVEQDSELPWGSETSLTVAPEEPVQFALQLRVPEWSNGVSVAINGDSVQSSTDENGYIELERTWQPGDIIEIEFGMEVRRLVAHPEVEASAGRVAFTRGPIVYCFEEVDNPTSPHHLRIPDDEAFEPVFEPELLGGLVTLRGGAVAPDYDEWEGQLYQEPTDLSPDDVETVAVPYYAWDHREPGDMGVWIVRE